MYHYHSFLQIDISTFQPNDWPMLEGILTVLPFIGNESTFGVNEKLQKDAFNICVNSSTTEDNFPQYLADISPFAMYTFDAAWALILALNRSSFDNKLPQMEGSSNCFNTSLQNDSQYHMYLQNTHFSGISGMIQFSKNTTNDRVNGSFYALYNIQPKGQRDSPVKRKPRHKHILTWHETTHSWKIGANESLNIIWPGNQSNRVPTDYPQLRGEEKRLNKP